MRAHCLSLATACISWASIPGIRIYGSFSLPWTRSRQRRANQPGIHAAERKASIRVSWDRSVSNSAEWDPWDRHMSNKNRALSTCVPKTEFHQDHARFRVGSRKCGPDNPLSGKGIAAAERISWRNEIRVSWVLSGARSPGRFAPAGRNTPVVVSREGFVWPGVS